MACTVENTVTGSPVSPNARKKHTWSELFHMITKSFEILTYYNYFWTDVFLKTDTGMTGEKFSSQEENMHAH